MASSQISMFRHETGSCYNSGMLCPICTKLHTFDKSHGLKTSCQCLVIDIAPPAGYRKLLVFNQIQHAMFNLHQTSVFLITGLKTYQIFSSFIYIVPPAVTENSLFYSNSNMHCPLCTKLHIFGKIPGLKTSKGQYSDVTIAPPVDKRMCQALH